MFHSTPSGARRDAKAAEAMNVESVKETSIPWKGVISMSRTPCDAILPTARSFQYDLILMATRGKMGALGTLLGASTTQEVLNKTSIPALVFPDT
jgi:nucleotide-binding universal stress UspA family protein